MKKKYALIPSILMAIVTFYLLGWLNCGEDCQTFFNLSDGNALGLSLFTISIIAIALILFFIVFGKRLAIEGWRRAEKAISGKKIYDVPDMKEEAMQFVRDFSPENSKKRLFIHGQRIVSPSSDTPYAFFLVANVSDDDDGKKRRWHDIEHRDKWVIHVDRTTNECSFNPDIDDEDKALEYKRELMKDATPAELKKSAVDKVMEASMKAELGKVMISGSPAAATTETTKEETE